MKLGIMKKRTFILMFCVTLGAVASLFAITSLEFKSFLKTARSTSIDDTSAGKIKMPREYVTWEAMGHTILSIN